MIGTRRVAGTSGGSPALLALTIAIGLWTSSACSGGTDPRLRALQAQYPGRTIPAARWDTVFWIGGKTTEDTTILDPMTFTVWRDQVAVLDFGVVRVFSRGGEPIWTHARRGAGPGELNQPFCIGPGAGGELWVLDHRNRKVLAFSASGEWHELSTRAFSVPVGPFGFGGKYAVFGTQTPEAGIIVADPGDFRVLRQGSYPWPEALTRALNLSAHVAPVSDHEFVMAFEYGPGFMIVNADDLAGRVVRYIDSIPFTLKGNPLRQARADSALWAARSVAVSGHEIVFLFGGRPRRRAHDGEPTVLLDVYDVDGTYRRSYVLPFNADHMGLTSDGVFVLLTETAEGLPAIVGLRPKPAH